MKIKEVWLAIRNLPPGANPSGEQSDPYDAYGDKFDIKMREFYANQLVDLEPYHIHLFPDSYYPPNTDPYLTKGQQLGTTTTGWKMGDGWIIEGAGIGVTTVQLTEWNDTGGGKHYVIGNANNENVRSLVVRDLTVDANWLDLANKPMDNDTAVHSVILGPVYGNATIENVVSINNYGDKASGKECFALLAAHPFVFDPNTQTAFSVEEASTITIRNCVVEDSHGDYVVGIVGSAYPAPGHQAVITGNVCRDLLGAGAYQAYGRGITLTDNKSFNCPAGFYVDTANLYDLVIARNQFYGCINGVLTHPVSNFFAINVRVGDSSGSLAGKYVDIPVKKAADPDTYVVRVWLDWLDFPGTNEPPDPAFGKKIPVSFHSNDSASTIKTALATALNDDETPDSSGDHLFSNVESRSLGDGGSVVGYPSSLTAGHDEDHDLGVWAGYNPMYVSDAAVFYAQRGFELQNWLIADNLFEILFNSSPDPQVGVALYGTDAPGCRDYTVTNNEVRFSPVGFTPGNHVYSYRTGAIAGNVSLIGNRAEIRADYYGYAEILQLPGATKCSFGNRTISGTELGGTIPGLEDAGAFPLKNEVRASVDFPVSQSPAAAWTGQGWTTDGLGASKPVEFRAYVSPIQGDDIPSGTWILESSINGGPFGNQLTYDSAGILAVSGGFSGDGASLTNVLLANALTTLADVTTIEVSGGQFVISDATTTDYFTHDPVEGEWVFAGQATFYGALVSSVQILNGSLSATATVTANLFSGSGASLTALNAGNLSTGIVPVARLPVVNGRVGSNVTVASTTPVNITSLSFAIGVNEAWTAEFHVTVLGASNGCKFQITGPASPTEVRMSTHAPTNGITAWSCDTVTAFSSYSGNYFTQTYTGIGHFYVTVLNGSNAGTVQLQFATPTGTNTNTVLINSYMTARRIN